MDNFKRGQHILIASQKQILQWKNCIRVSAKKSTGANFIRASDKPVDWPRLDLVDTSRVKV
jgi:hypothetical protein